MIVLGNSVVVYWIMKLCKMCTSIIGGHYEQNKLEDMESTGEKACTT